MSFTVHGIDGFLLVIAALCFLTGAIFAWVAPGHRAALSLVAAGLLLWVLTSLIR
jgi:hypothetical protein